MFSDQRADSAEHLTNRSQIAAILRRLQAEHPLLTVHLPDGQNFYTSTLLTIDTSADQLTLDELNPIEGHYRVRSGTQLKVEGRLAGISIYFTATVLEVRLEQEIHLYKVPLPDELLYQQRRGFIRIPLAVSLDTTATLRSNGKTLTAQLSDLSVAGMGGVILEGGSVAPGEHYHCSFELGAEAVTAQAEIRYSLDDAGQQHRFGALFHDLSPHPRRHIERAVMQLQREYARAGGDLAL